MPKLSIITINFNDDKGLERTIKSVIHQKYSNYEFIVIDGNSTDNSNAVIDTYKSHFSYWVSEDDTGIYNAMNKGIKQAKGDYLLFLNSGDSLIDNPNILIDIDELLQDDIVAFDCFLEKDSQIVGRRTHIERPSLFYVYKNGLKHQSTFIKKTLFNELGLYNETYETSSDYEFWIRCFLQPTTSSRSYTTPITVFQLGGISQNVDRQKQYRQIEKEWLGNLITDFQLLSKLLPYQNSRLLKFVIKIKKLL
jgi:glycosyltransferase involved in cell wall biosynthesis